MNASTKEDEAESAGDGLDTKHTLAPKLRVSIRTVDQYMRDGRIPYIKVGKTVRFRWSDVIAKLNECRVN